MRLLTTASIGQVPGCDMEFWYFIRMVPNVFRPFDETITDMEDSIFEIDEEHAKKICPDLRIYDVNETLDLRDSLTVDFIKINSAAPSSHATSTFLNFIYEASRMHKILKTDSNTLRDARQLISPEIAYCLYDLDPDLLITSPVDEYSFASFQNGDLCYPELLWMPPRKPHQYQPTFIITLAPYMHFHLKDISSSFFSYDISCPKNISAEILEPIVQKIRTTNNILEYTENSPIITESSFEIIYEHGDGKPKRKADISKLRNDLENWKNRPDVKAMFEAIELGVPVEDITA